MNEIMLKLIDLTGKRFGRLVVLKRVADNKHGKSMWVCKCNCGVEKIMSGNNLKTGHTKSCGCLSIEKTTERSTKHGHRHRGKTSKIYVAWNNMIARCTNVNDPAYHNYGGRGITICKRWMKFINFLADMGEPPTNKHSIDRIDNDKGYCKSNCEWVTRKEQQRNTRKNRLETYDGKTQCLAAWAEESGINPFTFYNRIWRGWSLDKALTTPIRGTV